MTQSLSLSLRAPGVMIRWWGAPPLVVGPRTAVDVTIATCPAPSEQIWQNTRKVYEAIRINRRGIDSIVSTLPLDSLQRIATDISDADIGR